MSLLEWLGLILTVGLFLVFWQLLSIRALLGRVAAILASVDAEVFHLAQEQNPIYGACSNCGRRDVVRHVVPTDRQPGPIEPELFFCQACWWMSESVRVTDDGKYYKDRTSERDRLASMVGPGTA